MLSRLCTTCQFQARRSFGTLPKRKPNIFDDTRGHGFLPRVKPIAVLPSEFSDLEQILQKMIIHQPDGSKGLLGQNLLRKTVEEDFPDLTERIMKMVDPADDRLNAALFRDFSFLSSAYLLEPCHQMYLKTKKDYGQGMTVMPRKLAVPMKMLADRIDYGIPLLEYGHGYALNNWKFVNDPNPHILEYDNDSVLPPYGVNLKDHIQLVRMFNGCTDEAGFVLVHVAIITQTYRQIQSYDVIFPGAFEKNREKVNEGLRQHLSALRDMYDLMSTMWKESSPQNYLQFRTFIMGIQGNDDLFPGGVLYEGVSDEKLVFRGETGAQDSMIPTSDSALGLIYPRNQLTEYLFDLRKYRPAPHQELVDWCKAQNEASRLNEFAMQDSYTSFLMLCNVHAAYRFRHQHWSMVKSYIIKNSKYPRATGGTPITTWLPNQIGACLEMCQELMKCVDATQLSSEDTLEFKRLSDEINSEIDRLFKEVVKIQEEFDAKSWRAGDQEINQFQSRDKLEV